MTPLSSSPTLVHNNVKIFCMYSNMLQIKREILLLSARVITWYDLL